MALTDNIVAYWKCDEGSGTSLADSVGSNTGTLNNSNGWATGIVGNAPSYNGTGGAPGTGGTYVDCGNSSSLNPASLSVSLWINPSNLSGTHFFFARDDNSLGRSYALYANGTGLSIQQNGAALLSASSQFSTSTWAHVVYVNDSTLGAIAYVNGTSVATHAYSAPSSTTGSTTIGKRTYASNQYPFAGIIDEIGLWSRALTSTEVTQLYNSGSGLQYPFSGGGGGGQPLFRRSLLNGLGSGGPLFNNPLGRSMIGWLPGLVTQRCLGRDDRLIATSRESIRGNNSAQSSGLLDVRAGQTIRGNYSIAKKSARTPLFFPHSELLGAL